MKFKKEFMQRLAYGDIDTDEGEVIENKIVETTRWNEIHVVVFKVDGKFYSSNYSQGLESPYEYEKDFIECAEVEPKKIEVVQYVPVKNTTDESVSKME